MNAFKQTPTSGRRAFFASTDLALALLILLSITIPTLGLISYSQEMASYNSKNTQKLSILVQEAAYQYSYGAAEQNSRATIFDVREQMQFTKIGNLAGGFNPSAKEIEARRANLSLQFLSYRLSPPGAGGKNQICIMRKMLYNSTNPAPVWVCGY